MLWYGSSSLPQKTAAGDSASPVRPPAYIEERISDLDYAKEFFYKDPAKAKQILAKITEQLIIHHDNTYVAPIKEAPEML